MKTLEKILCKIKVLKNSEFYQLIITNLSWLLVEKILRMGGGLFIGIWTARYLGVNQFGLLNYIISFNAFFIAFADLGMESLISREIINRPIITHLVLGTAFYLRLVSGVLTFIFAFIVIYIFKGHDHYIVILMSISATSFIFGTFDVIDYYFQSQSKSQYSTISKSISFLIFSTLKVLLLLYAMPLVWFVLITTLEIAFAGSLLLFFYYKYEKHIEKWKFNFDVAKWLLSKSIPMIMTGLSVTIFMRIDAVMIKELMNDKAVGEYAAAVKISEVWYIFPTLIISAMFPLLAKLKLENEFNFQYFIRKLASYLFWFSLLISVVFFFISDFIIQILFGNEYSSAANVLVIHIWSSVPFFLGSCWSCWIILEKMQQITFMSHLLTSILNVILNLFLIPRIGIPGAALATLISYLIGWLFSMFLYKWRLAFSLFLKPVQF